MGVHGFGERNTEGEKILEFCQSRGLRVVNSLFTKEREKRK